MKKTENQLRAETERLKARALNREAQIWNRMMTWLRWRKRGSRPIGEALQPKELSQDQRWVLRTAQEKESSPKSSIKISVQAANMRTASLGEFLTLDELTIIGDLAQNWDRTSLHNDVERLIIRPNIYRIMASLKQDVNPKQLAFAIAAAWPTKNRSLYEKDVHD